MQLHPHELIFTDPIRVINFLDYRKRRNFPRFPEDKKLCQDLSTVDFTESFLIFISHCWLRGSKSSPGFKHKPHPDNSANEKFKLSVEAIEKLWGAFAPDMKHCFLWLDYGCINQDGDPAGELRQLDKIIQCSDCLLTVIVDTEWNSWEYGNTMDGLIVDYKAKAWIDGYLSRAWCRVEMLYAANIPLVSDRKGPRMQKFRAGFRAAMESSRRAHFLYGTKESQTMFHPQLLCPLSYSYIYTHSPAAGKLSYESDRNKISELMDTLTKYQIPLEVGYSGATDNQGRFDGCGKLTLPNGFVYDGSWKDNIPDGQAKVMWPNGDFYAGSVERGHISGKGLAYFANGNMQNGTWKNGLLHGTGSFSYCTGTTFDGTFCEGLISGRGKAVFADGVVFFDGNWIHGVPDMNDFWIPCYSLKFCGCLCFKQCSHHCLCAPFDPLRAQHHIEWTVVSNAVVDAMLCGSLGWASSRRGGGLVISPLPDIVDLHDQLCRLQRAVDTSSSCFIWKTPTQEEATPECTPDLE